MAKNKFFSGVGMGFVAGTAIGIAFAMQKKKRSGKGVLCKAVRTIGSAMEDLATTLGL